MICGLFLFDYVLYFGIFYHTSLRDVEVAVPYLVGTRLFAPSAFLRNTLLRLPPVLPLLLKAALFVGAGDL